LTSARDATVVRPVFRPGTRSIDVAATSRDVIRDIHAAAAPVVLLATVLEVADLFDLTAAEADAIPRSLGAVTAAVLAEASVGGLYTTGGDVTAEVLDGLGGVGIEVVDEVVPLATAGTLVGGPHTGLPIVTKGGLVGGTDTAGICLDALAELAVRPAHHARPHTPTTARPKDLP
ncbi:MAG TPA: nucleotide-binding domain containing protein, partial [Brevibacterium sp.]|nr:nucleotide-binding domain containing protein [Brevibacterium sp.]